VSAVAWIPCLSSQDLLQKLHSLYILERCRKCGTTTLCETVRLGPM
jgi:hypothetical protein